LEKLAEKGRSYRQWTPAEVAIVRRYFGRVNLPDLMRHLPGRTRAAICQQANRLGLTCRARD